MRRLCRLAVLGSLVALAGCGTAPATPSLYRADRTAGASAHVPARALDLRIAGDGYVSDRFHAWEGEMIRFDARVQGAASGALTYKWETDGHFLGKDSEARVDWLGIWDGWYEVTCTVTDASGQSASRTDDVFVRQTPGSDDRR